MLHSVLGGDHCSLSLTLLHFLMGWYKGNFEIIWTYLFCNIFFNLKMNTKQLLALHILLLGLL
jgi:hypothetical protein